MDTAKLTEAAVRRLPAPAQGNRITYEPSTPGFGCRVTAAGHRAFILTYYNSAGRQRRYTMAPGRRGRWSAHARRPANSSDTSTRRRPPG